MANAFHKLPLVCVLWKAASYFLSYLARKLKTTFTWRITPLKTVELTQPQTALYFLLRFLSELLIAEIDLFKVLMLHALTKREVRSKLYGLGQ